MASSPLRQVLLLCRSLEKIAAKIYQSISVQALDDDQKAFWQDISQEEERHMAYWDQLLVLEAEKKFDDIFDRPDETKAELKALKRTIDGMLKEDNDCSDRSIAMLVAFRLEFLMLNPSFAMLFRVLRNELDDLSPGEDYREHLNKFLLFVRKFLPLKKELELIGEILVNVWKNNLELADHFAQIKTLRGFIPICSSCKKIRNDKGYWSRIEAYLEEHSDAQFTHGICPDCLKTLYPEYYEKKKQGK